MDAHKHREDGCSKASDGCSEASEALLLAAEGGGEKRGIAMQKCMEHI